MFELMYHPFSWVLCQYSSSLLQKQTSVAENQADANPNLEIRRFLTVFDAVYLAHFHRVNSRV